MNETSERAIMWYDVYILPFRFVYVCLLLHNTRHSICLFVFATHVFDVSFRVACFLYRIQSHLCCVYLNESVFTDKNTYVAFGSVFVRYKLTSIAFNHIFSAFFRYAGERKRERG